MLAKAQTVIRIEIEALEALVGRLDGGFATAVLKLKEVLDGRGKIVVVGVGKSGNIGHKIAATLNSTGATAVVLNPQNALHGDLGMISDGDAVLALSYSGETPEVLGLLPFIKRAEVVLISLTGQPDSSLGRLSDVVLDTSVPREACPLNLAPTSSSTAMLAMGDALAMVLLEARGFTEQDFARYHPGGSLGRSLLTRVGDIMRHDAALATVGLRATVSAALAGMSAVRAGACLILTDDGALAGIFTHGDFSRAFQRDGDIGARRVSEFMTANPISVRADALAAEAVKMIGSKRIDDVVVLNEEGRPVGLVDAQDFARLKIV